MEAKSARRAAATDELATLFGDLVRLETEVWDLVDRRLRTGRLVQPCPEPP